jgi:uncharacterized protein (TIGR02145 family)
MKKLLGVLLVLLYSCSTTSDGTTTNTTVVSAPPENLTGTVISTTSINLIWTDRSTNETGFKIERKLESGTFEVIGTTATNVATFSNTGLAPSTSYVYRVYSYNEGGKSPVYSNELKLTTNSTMPSIIAIGAQKWTTKNLDVTTYRDGTPIPQVTDPTAWVNLTTGAWCYYNNDSANGIIYGKLYNWYAYAGIWNEASKTDANQRKKLAPTGYHVPSSNEWADLTTYLGGTSEAGGKMKETGTTHWVTSNSGVTNGSGFTGLPAGLRSNLGTFDSIRYSGIWWSDSVSDTPNAWAKKMTSSYFSVFSDFSIKTCGFSVRCLKD